MKKAKETMLIVFLMFLQGCLTTGGHGNNLNQPVEVEKALVTCEPFGPRPTLAVMPFKIAAGCRAQREAGDGLSDMLMNALVETQCFRVVERSRLEDIMQEQGLILGGNFDEQTAARVGGLAGAQLLVMGTVTEFKENESGGLGGFGLPKIISVLGMTNAHIGLIVRIVDSTTGEILISKSVNKKVTKVGLAAGGGSLFGFIGAAFFKSQAMQDALEKALIETVAIIARQKDRIVPSTGIAQHGQPGETSLTTVDCSQIASPTGPRFMVVIPEIHIRRQVPDPAGETEIIRKFLEKGLTVVDQQQIAAIRYQEKVLNAVKNPQAAAALGVEFGADIIVVGEAFSEFAKRGKTMVNCRARVEAKAIQTSSGRILAANGTHAGGADIAELVAGKKALRNAGSKLADYFIGQLCRKNFSQPESQVSAIEIQLTNVNFQHLQKFASMLEGFSGVQHVQKQLTGNTARIQTQYKGKADKLASLISNGNSSGVRFNITGFSEKKIMLTVSEEGKDAGGAGSD